MSTPHRRAPFAPLIAALVAGAALPAQGRLLIVDASQGPGTQFTDIPPAVAAAASGDRIAVRPGSYSGFRIDGKAIAVTGGPGVVVDRAPASIDVANVPAGRDCVVAGILVGTLWAPGSLRVDRCDGRVLIQTLVGTWAPGGVVLSNCAQVMLTGCAFGAGLRIDGCTATLGDSAFFGAPVFGFPSAGLELVGAQVTMSRCDASGAVYLVGGAPGIQMTSSSLTLTGDGSRSIRASSAAGGTDSPAVAGTGTVVLDPRVVLQPTGSAPAIATAITRTIADMPSLSARTGPLGGLVTVDLCARPGEVYGMVVGLPGDAVDLPPFGTLWLQLSGIVAVDSGVLDPTGTRSWTLTVPNAPALIGARLTWQAVAGPPTRLRLSNAAGYAHWL